MRGGRSDGVRGGSDGVRGGSDGVRSSGRHDLSTHSMSDFTYVVMVTGCSKQLFFTTC